VTVASIVGANETDPATFMGEPIVFVYDAAWVTDVPEVATDWVARWQ
jgi:hypothetical protein